MSITIPKDFNEKARFAALKVKQLLPDTEMEICYLGLGWWNFWYNGVFVGQLSFYPHITETEILEKLLKIRKRIDKEAKRQ